MDAGTRFEGTVRRPARAQREHGTRHEHQQIEYAIMVVKQYHQIEFATVVNSTSKIASAIAIAAAYPNPALWHSARDRAGAEGILTPATLRWHVCPLNHLSTTWTACCATVPLCMPRHQFIRTNPIHNSPQEADSTMPLEATRLCRGSPRTNQVKSRFPPALVAAQRLSRCLADSYTSSAALATAAATACARWVLYGTASIA